MVYVSCGCMHVWSLNTITNSYVNILSKIAWKYVLWTSQSFNINNFKDIWIPEMILDSLTHHGSLGNVINPTFLYVVIWRMLKTFVAVIFIIFLVFHFSLNVVDQAPGRNFLIKNFDILILFLFLIFKDICKELYCHCSFSWLLE